MNWYFSPNGCNKLKCTVVDLFCNLMLLQHHPKRKQNILNRSKLNFIGLLCCYYTCIKHKKSNPIKDTHGRKLNQRNVWSLLGLPVLSDSLQEDSFRVVDHGVVEFEVVLLGSERALQRGLERLVLVALDLQLRAQLLRALAARPRVRLLVEVDRLQADLAPRPPACRCQHSDGMSCTQLAS